MLNLVPVLTSPWKKLSYLIALMIFCKVSEAQRTPPVPYSPIAKINYVRTWEATAPEQNPALLITRPLKDVRQTTAYFDGLGRPIQTVLKQGSLATGGAQADLVSPVEYDAFGREEHKYLPFAANTTGNNSSVNDGNFKLNPFQQQAAFAAVQYPGETYYYGRTQFEASPLNRVEKIFAAGNSWVGGNRGVETKYWTNTAADDVKIWTVTNISGMPGSYSMSGIYTAGTLFKNVTLDEAGKQVIEFKDKEGKVILKKVQLGATSDDGTGKGYAGFLNTYYIYDDLNNLRCVIQPKGVELISAANWELTNTTILAEQCFRYEYDDRQRMIIKKVPGAGEIYMIYDVRDRLVFTQDPNMRSSGQWMSTLYDGLNRPVLTGLITYIGTREQLQNLVTLQTAGTTGGNPVASDLTLNTLTASGAYYATNSITLDPGFESENGALLTAELINSNGGSDATPSMIEGVAVNRNPLPAGTTLDPLTFTWYDNYQWAATLNSNLKDFAIGTVSSYLLTASNNNYPYAQPVTKSDAVTGLTTGTKVRILGSHPAQYITTVNFYDEEGRLVQVRSQNSTGGYDASTTQYGWSDKPLVMIQEQQKTAPNAQTHTIISQISYDDLGRVLTVNKTVSSNIGGSVFSKPQQEIVRNEYDAIGQLKKKTIGNGIEQLDYEFNIRGRLLGMNRNFVKDASQRYFGFELGYDKTAAIISGTSYANPQYNGNISGTIWKSAGDNEKRKFDYSYDATNRLTAADFNQYTGNAFSKPNGLNFSVDNLSYDANGNILSMQQHGWKMGQPGALIDDLAYTYYSSSNKLKNVLDAGNDVNTALGDFRSSQLYMTALGTKNNAATDYTYDANGNLKRDLNKDIGTSTNDGIVYNILNLPQSITVQKSGGVKGTISYVYDAAGNKHQKIVAETGKAEKRTLYLGDAVYENDTLQFFGQEEGRLRYGKHYFVNGDSALEYNYDYFLKDHLGNVRMVLTEQRDTSKYVATMELPFRSKEELLFSNINTAIPTPSYYPSDINVTNPNGQVAMLNGTAGKKIGPSMVLKVMSGDKVNLFVKSYYQPATAGVNNLPTEEIVSALANTFLGVFGSGKGSLSELTDINSPLTGGIGMFRNQNQQNIPIKPKAYLNWILFDEQFNYVSTSSGASGVGAPGQLFPHVPDTVRIGKNGYLYIYTSNETQHWEVLFNDLMVEHLKGRIFEETHYYPFGLTIAGISTRVLGIAENKKWKFQGQELNDDAGVGYYEFKYRNHDPQIGRFIQIDPLSDKYVYNSTYAFSENKVTAHVELEGLESADYLMGLFKKSVAKEFQSTANSIDKNLSVGSKTTTETTTSTGSNTSSITSASTTTTTHTNFGPIMHYIISNNTNEGNIYPFFVTDTKTEVNSGTKSEFTTPIASGSTSFTQNDEGTSTSTASVTVKRQGVDIGMDMTSNTKGDMKISGTVGAKFNNSTVKTSAGIGMNQAKGTGNFEVKLVFDQKKDNVRVKQEFFFKIGQ